MFQIVLFQPEIPPNTGSIGRTCVATDCPLHLVGKLGFSIEDRYLKRAGLDYWEHVNLTQHASWPDFLRYLEASFPEARIIYFSKKASQTYTDFSFRKGDVLVFGPETTGLPDSMIPNDGHYLRIPTTGKVRSLNLSVAVGVVLFEALRQTKALS